MLPLRARVGLGVIAVKEYSAFPKAPALLKPDHQIVSCHIQDTRCGGGESYPSAKMQSVHSLAPDWATCFLIESFIIILEYF